MSGVHSYAEAAEVAEILSEYGVQPHECTPVVNALRKNPRAWLDFMMNNFTQVDERVLPTPKLKAGNGDDTYARNGR